MIANYLGVLVLGAVCCLIQAFVLGAASLCIFWGPAVGAKVIPYRTAVFLEIGCQLVGNIAFGPTHLSPYAGVLKPGTLVTSPELVLYGLLCVAVVLPIWHLLAFWKRVPLSPFTGLAMSLVGVAVVFPGKDAVDVGDQVLRKPPFASGLGPTCSAWIIIPLISFVCGALIMLSFRNILRREDPFHQILWRLPGIGCVITLVAISYILYALADPQGIKVHALPPQGAVLIICGCGILICVYTCLVAPCSIRRFGYAIRPEVQIRRMSLLGLPEDVVKELAASSAITHDMSWFKIFWSRFLQKDIFADISKDDTLIQIHSTAEPLDPISEGLFHQSVLFQCVLLSMSYSASIFSSAGGVFASMLNIYLTGKVPDTFSVPIYLRCAAAVCTSLGAILAGHRLMPVTGVQLCKLTPVRAGVVMYASGIAAIIGRALGMAVPLVYISMAAIVAVGAIEGLSHVNWRVFFKMALWWYLGCIPVFLVSAFLNWQGTISPSAAAVFAMQADNAQQHL